MTCWRIKHSQHALAYIEFMPYETERKPTCRECKGSVVAVGGNLACAGKASFVQVSSLTGSGATLLCLPEGRNGGLSKGRALLSSTPEGTTVSPARQFPWTVKHTEILGSGANLLTIPRQTLPSKVQLSCQTTSRLPLPSWPEFLCVRAFRSIPSLLKFRARYIF